MDRLHRISLGCYTDSLHKLSERWSSLFNPLVDMVSKVDLYKSSAKVSIYNGYCKPEIVEEGYGYLNAKDIRHPIIEKINTDTEYITNDISIGRDINGMLLYGVNASGKSSLMKSVGLNIILAQAGMWVLQVHLPILLIVPCLHVLEIMIIYFVHSLRSRLR